jgi:hypothetical protein
MPKTPSEDLELISMRFPSSLMSKVREEAEANHLAVAHEARVALETHYLVGLPPPMAEMLESDRKSMGLGRQAYFQSLLDSRYRTLLMKEMAEGQAAQRGKGPKGK